MEATVVSVGKSVLDGALSYAKSAIAEEVTLQLGVQQDQGFIKDELEMMLSFLRAADKEQGHNEVFQTWVKQVRDVAYDVEDCLQDYVVRLEKPSWWRRRLSCTTLRERHRIATVMKEMRGKVEDVSLRNSRYKLLGGPAAASEPSPLTAAELQSTTFDDIEATRVAKQQEKVDLVDLITKDGDGLQEIAVWGTSGATGVASVVWLAYQKVKDRFPECHAWVKVMHPFDAKEFIGSLVSQFKANSHEGTSNTPQGTPSGVSALNEMEAKDYNLLDDFCKYVANKKYLIALNGLCNIEEWDWIKTYLPNKHNGSRILVCTPQAEVAICWKNKDGYKVSEIRQEGSFVTPLYVFYEEVKDSPTEQTDKTKSSSNATASTEGRKSPPVPNERKDPESQVIDLISKETKPSMASSSTGGDNHPEGLRESSSPSLNKDPNAAVKKLTRCTAMVPKRSRTVVAAEEAQLMIGRRNEKDKLIKMLDSGCDAKHRVISVISVWGMGGIGKTTLVKSIYQSSELEKLGFERRAWVPVSRPFRRIELLRILAQRLVKDSPGKKVESTPGLARSGLSMMGSKELIDKLKQDLTGKKYLIVLDDLSTTTEWDFIKTMFPENSSSRIIVTTRPKLVAQHCSEEEEYMHRIGDLKDKDALDLFLDKNY
ncbi:hypothetical protein OsI_30079 [Oryza sativa Indica Group]|uniref:Uncharacterized protein n=1 Tax=Oryza sativa subsp. indica TaxID=39946 RepID=B8B961_ORYSI|nr:hypothetical protein OsI_30079 [Oryza sativa Indica Group]